MSTDYKNKNWLLNKLTKKQ